MLDSQVSIYAVDTGNFYSNNEARLHWKNHQYRVERNNLIEVRKKLEQELYESEITEEDLKLILKEEKEIEEYSEEQKEKIKELKRINK